MVDKVLVTADAAAVISQLREKHGPLMFHQSGGCCDGSAPMCYPKNEFKVGSRDVRLGRIQDCDFYIGAAQYDLWKHTQLIIDVVQGRGAGFSLEAPEGVRFITRSRTFSKAELVVLLQAANIEPAV